MAHRCEGIKADLEAGVRLFQRLQGHSRCWPLCQHWTLCCCQVRFQSLTDKSVLEAEPELFIHMQPDKTNNTLTIRDSGVGMTKADLVNNLGAFLPGCTG